MTDYNQYKSWPFVEAKKILKRLDTEQPKKKIIFETGYGPSGLPHIGTFGEVLRTNMVRFCFEKLTGLETDLIAFSDDMDGFRKVPDNVPNKELLSKYLDYPLTSVPDPFNKFNSFGEHNNAKLVEFLKRFNLPFTFQSSTELANGARPYEKPEDDDDDDYDYGASGSDGAAIRGIAGGINQ